ncbi:MAG: class I SAM-dependent methyltransferase [Burkholderiales bacterium]|nr:class I SAM-dependent methyltransferase [Anaerolineae bacterium]
MNDDVPGLNFDAIYTRAGGDMNAVPWAYLLPNPNLKIWAEREGVQGTGKTALVVGCGLGDDAEYLNALGFNVTAFDISPTAIEWAQQRFPNSRVNYQVVNVLEPPQAWRGAFDFVLEIHTIQALHPQFREKIIANIAGFVAKNGTLVVIAWAREHDAPNPGIPWPLSKEELQQFTQRGLIEVSFEDIIDPAEPPPRRFRVVYRGEAGSTA